MLDTDGHSKSVYDMSGYHHNIIMPVRYYIRERGSMHVV